MAPRKKAAEDAAPEAENDVQMEDVSAADAEPEQQFEDHDPALLAFEEQRIRIPFELNVERYVAPFGAGAQLEPLSQWPIYRFMSVEPGTKLTWNSALLWVNNTSTVPI
ncbi:hypothetical protein DH86_00004366 [Scytalidium sp. 3C]|nr:hypothetical protein DH86_00004366 [Scytalidium sp. 3C]